MATTRAATTHDKQKNPKPTGQMSQEQTYGQRQPEHVSESSPPLHRYLGNSYVQAIITKTQRPGLQLTVNEPGDIYEREAHRIADQAMAAPTHANISSAPLQIQRFSEPSSRQGDAAPASVAQTLTSPGRPMEPALRQDMEQRFGYDFSDVRVHTGAAAEQSARDVHARAYTMGHHMVFGAGRFAPETTEGRQLIAHELTHVAQMSALGSPSSLTAALRLPILRQPESGADSDEEERRRRARSSSAWLDRILWMALGDDPPLLIQWAEKQQSKFEDMQWTEEERLYIAEGLLRVRTRLRELEVKAKHGPDGALVYSYIGDQKPWTQDRARKLDDIAPFTAANIAAWREAAAWQPPVTSVAKRPPRKKTSPQKRPAEPPERPSFAVNITFPKQEGMTFETEEGQGRIAFALIRSTRSTYTNEQIAWAVSRIDLSQWWAPPGNLDLPTWRENFEATPIGDKVTMGLSERFTIELDNILTEKPTEHDIQVELGRQAVLSAAPTTYLAYAGPAGLMTGTIIGSGLAFLPQAGTVGGGGLTTGGGGALAGGEGSLLLGGTIRQSALYAARHLYLNAPRLYGEASFWGGTIVSSVALAEHIREIRERGLRWSDAPRFVQDLFPFFHGNYERYSFRGSPQSPREGPPVAGSKPVPANVPGVTPPPAPVGPAATAKNPPISFPRRNLIQGPFPAPPATPAAPAPARPVMPPVATGRTVAPPASVKPTPPAVPVQPPTASTLFRPKPWLVRVRDKFLAKTIEGVVEGTELPEISGTIGTRPATTVTAKAPPSSPAPTPDLPPRMLATPRIVSPAKIVTPSAPTPSPTSVGTVRSPASAPKTPNVTTAPSAGAVGISQMIDEGRINRGQTPIGTSTGGTKPPTSPPAPAKPPGSYENPLTGVYIGDNPVSSAGVTGSGATSEHGVYHAKLPGQWEGLVKTYPRTEVRTPAHPDPNVRPADQVIESRRAVEDEIEVGRIAEAAGVGVPIHGFVEIPHGPRISQPSGSHLPGPHDAIGFAMGRAPGGHFELGDTNTAAQAQERANNAANINDLSFADVRTFRDALTDAGWTARQIEGFVGPDGRWRPIDFAGYDRGQTLTPPMTPDEIREHNNKEFAEYFNGMVDAHRAALNGEFDGYPVTVGVRPTP